MNKQYPVGKAQQTVLDALGISASGFADADAKFSELGIAVNSKRGIPSISFINKHDHEGHYMHTKLTVAQIEAIKTWISGDVPSDAIEAEEILPREDTAEINEISKVKETLEKMFDEVDMLHHQIGVSSPYFQDIEDLQNEIMSLISKTSVNRFFARMHNHA